MYPQFITQEKLKFLFSVSMRNSNDKIVDGNKEFNVSPKFRVTRHNTSIMLHLILKYSHYFRVFHARNVPTKNLQ